MIANAGIATGGTVRSIDPDAWERVVEVNLIGSWRTIRAALPHVIARRGYVLQIASLAAVAHAPFMSAYSVSKAGVEALADSLRTEVARHGVDVGVAYFSWIDTDMVRGADARRELGGMREKLSAARWARPRRWRSASTASSTGSSGAAAGSPCPAGCARRSCCAARSRC